MAAKNNYRNNMGNKKKSIQSREDQQQPGLQNSDKSPASGMRSDGKVHMSGQGSVAGSTGTGNQGKTGNSGSTK
jgi:hypothetical protein